MAAHASPTQHIPSNCTIVTILDILDLLCTTKQTGASGGDETDFLSGARVTGDRRCVTNVLMITTTVRVINGVHGHTASLRPRVPLGPVLMEGPASLEQGLIDPATTSNDANRGSRVAGDNLFGAAGKLEAGLAFVVVMANDDGVVT